MIRFPVRSALALLLAQCLCAQVKVAVEPVSLLPGQVAVLSASLAQPEGGSDWLWSLPERDSGSLEPGANGSCRYRAPADFLMRDRIIAVQVQPADGPAPAVTVPIRIAAGLLFDRLLPASGYLEYPDPLEPRMGLLAGHPEQSGTLPGPGPEARFPMLARLAFTGDHPDPDQAGRWLVLTGGDNRIRLMDPDGRVRPWQERCLLVERGPGCSGSFLGGAPIGVAVRPPGPDRGPWRAVFTSLGRPCLWEVNGRGEVRLLAGAAQEWGYRDGPAPESRFQSPTDVVIAADGAVYVADRGNAAIRKVYQGEVTTLAGGVGFQARIDGCGQGAVFIRPTGLAQDRQSGHLYVLDGLGVRRVTLGGEVLSLAGCRGVGFEAWRTDRSLQLGAGADRMRDVGCLDHPEGITAHRGKLYIADTGNHALRVLDLATGELSTLAGHPSQDRFRPGRLRAGRDLAPESCAALSRPCHVAFDDAGHGLVAMNGEGWGACIAELSMAGLLQEATGPAPGAP
jgi:hypothetical protein